MPHVRICAGGVGKPTSLPQPLMIDADAFKAYNDAFGHRKGDSLLQKIAEAIAESANRAGDLAARYGGEEFAVLLPSTSIQGAIVVAEGIRQLVADLNEPNPSTRERIATISIGIACIVPQVAQHRDDLVVRADKALYAAKSGGRNRCEVAAANVTTQGVRSLAERRQAPMVPNTVLNVPEPEVMRAVATTVRTAASPLADHIAR